MLWGDENNTWLRNRTQKGRGVMAGIHMLVHVFTGGLWKKSRLLGPHRVPTGWQPIVRDLFCRWGTQQGRGLAHCGLGGGTVWVKSVGRKDSLFSVVMGTGCLWEGSGGSTCVESNENLAHEVRRCWVKRQWDPHNGAYLGADDRFRLVVKVHWLLARRPSCVCSICVLGSGLLLTGNKQNSLFWR